LNVQETALSDLRILALGLRQNEAVLESTTTTTPPPDQHTVEKSLSPMAEPEAEGLRYACLRRFFLVCPFS
jgi:hypothetical protein